MSTKPIEITGGESVYCFNQGQLKSAYDLVMKNKESAGRLRPILKQLRTDLTRNEQAALAFVMIDRLLKNPD